MTAAGSSWAWGKVAGDGRLSGHGIRLAASGDMEAWRKEDRDGAEDMQNGGLLGAIAEGLSV